MNEDRSALITASFDGLIYIFSFVFHIDIIAIICFCFLWIFFVRNQKA